MHTLAIFGGTFDPIHNGHLKISLNIQADFKFDSYVFLPCKIPVLKSPAAATEQDRINMIELAIKNYPDFKIDLREIKRDTPSYMVHTLESFRLEFPQSAITLIIGYDAFLSLPHWHQWEKLITLANLLVIQRNEVDPNNKGVKAMHDFLKKYQNRDKTSILNQTQGVVFLFDAGHYPFSSTLIRKQLNQKEDASAELPREVYQYIKDEGLYNI